MPTIRNSPYSAMHTHNPDGVSALVRSLKEMFPGERFLFVTGVLKDKDYSSMIEMTLPLGKKYYTVTPDSPRALRSEELREYLKSVGAEAEAFDSIEEAGERAWSQRDYKTVAFGSLYYIGNLRTVLKKHL